MRHIIAVKIQPHLKIVNIPKAIDIVSVLFYQYWNGSNAAQKGERCENQGWPIVSTEQRNLSLLLCVLLSFYSTRKRAPAPEFTFVAQPLLHYPFRLYAVLLGQVKMPSPLTPAAAKGKSLERQTCGFSTHLHSNHPHPQLRSSSGRGCTGSRDCPVPFTSPSTWRWVMQAWVAMAADQATLGVKKKTQKTMRSTPEMKAYWSSMKSCQRKKGGGEQHPAA